VKGGRLDDQAIEFLPEAQEIEQRPIPPLAHIAVHLLLAFVIAAIAWASLSQIDEVVIARGKLVTTESSIVVQPLETGVVKSLDAQPGQLVKRGQQLASLDPTFVEADSAQLQARLDSLQAQITRLEAEAAGRDPKQLAGADAALQAELHVEKQQNFAGKLQQLDQTIEGLKAGLVTNERDQRVLAARVKSLNEIEAMHQSLLEQNFGAKLQLLEARERRLEVERELALAVNRATEMSRELAATQAQRSSFTKEWRQKGLEELVAARRERDALVEQLQKAAKRREMVVLAAPADAVVLDVAKRSVGSVLREAEPLYTLVPLGGSTEAELQIDTRDIGRVRASNKVRVKVDAFPFQKHGTIDGELRTVSGDAFARDRAAPMGPELYYTARASLGAFNLRGLAADARLVPGMSVSGEIVVGQRRVISYFTYPLLRAFDEAIREP
jgi:HlyD family secretion protein